jgi:hypothetical protein
MAAIGADEALAIVSFRDAANKFRHPRRIALSPLLINRWRDGT